MYSEDIEGAGAVERSGEDVYSKPIRAGKRTYFFDVKATKGNDYYLTITESKRKAEGLQEVIDYIKENCLKDAPASERKEDGNNFSDVSFEEL